MRRSSSTCARRSCVPATRPRPTARSACCAGSWRGCGGGFPRARFLVRLDGGFATPALLEFLDAEPTLDYVVAMAGNAVLKRIAEPAMAEARALSEASGQTAHVYVEARYATRTWRHARRVVIKAEVVRLPGRTPRDNPRFVITNLRQTPRFLYERVYCARGDIENRKELHD